ncbi:UNVERIFIED_CONTAM: glpK [Trichonephila clavipes]
MAMKRYLLAIDQGTTSTRAIVFDSRGTRMATAQVELPQHFPADGWVEHDAMDIWWATETVCRDVLRRVGLHARDISAIGITNQRETTVLWDRRNGMPVHRAIVWQDRRTGEACARLKAAGHEPAVQAKTGLLLDPYFSATKLAWLLDNVPGARDRAERGELAFGTVDSWLLWKLTHGQVHATDATNASRTLLFNIHTQRWDPELLALFDIPAAVLPEVKDSSDDFGVAAPDFLGAPVPICGVAGDQQAALIGQACFQPGMVKSTYGTGCFLVLNTGDSVVKSTNRLLSTVAYRLNGKPTYAVEGSIFVAGATIQWLRDGLRLIASAAQCGWRDVGVHWRTAPVLGGLRLVTGRRRGVAAARHRQLGDRCLVSGRRAPVLARWSSPRASEPAGLRGLAGLDAGPGACADRPSRG